MESIALKIKTLNYDPEVYSMVNKFWATLTDNIVSLEEVVQIVNYLNEKDINIKKPSQNKVLANGIDYIRNQIELMEQIGEIDAYREDITRVNSKNAINRLKYLKSINAEYKNKEGKYSKLIFSKKLFEKEYGVVDFKNIEIKQENTKDEIISLEREIKNAMSQKNSINENKEIDTTEDFNANMDLYAKLNSLKESINEKKSNMFVPAIDEEIELNNLEYRR